MKKILMIFVLALTTTALALGQAVQISGTVTSAEDGTAIPGVTIFVKGTTVGTATDVDGTYKLLVPENGQILVFSFVGFKTVEVPIEGKKTINIKMETDLMMVDEVLVVAYGTAKKSTFTGSAEIIKSEQLAKIQSASVVKALEGAAPGIQVTGGTGQPGSSANIRIRGIGSVNASSAPLYVVDGAPFDGDMNTLNNNDIESMTVLKDATSAALYGARGANGVVIITTKKGVAGQTKVNFKASLGTVTRAVPEYDRVSIPQYYELMWEGWVNAIDLAMGYTHEQAAAFASSGTANGIVAKLGGYNSYDVTNDQLIGLDGKINPDAKLLYSDDWNDELSQTGIRQEYNLSVSGGTEKSNYYASVAYLDETGMVKWSDYNRITGRVGASSQVNKWFKMDASISGTTSKQNGFLAEGTYTTNPFYYGRMMGPIYPIYQRNSDGTIALDPNGDPLYDMGGGATIYTWAGHKRPYAPNSNLVVTLPLDERSTALNTMSARVGGEVSFLKDFKLRVTGNTDMSNYYYTTYQNNKFGDAQAVAGRSTKEYDRVVSYTFNQILTWNKQFGDNNFAVLAGHENYKYTYNELWATRTGYTISTTELVAGAIAEGSSSSADEYKNEGYLFQANYDFASKYYLSGSFRYDGSSRFHKDVRWGSFWSLGGSWRMNEEAFLKSVRWIDNLKIKFSMGEQGNDNIGTYYGWQSLYSIDDRNNATTNGAWYDQLENRRLKWEKNTNINAGIEFGFVNRIRGTVEFFRRESSNLLFSVPLPQSTGISSKWANIGTMNNTGFELTLSADIVKMNNLVWTIDLNATHYTNKITKMPVGADGKPQEMISGTKKLAEGHSIYDFWLRESAGVNPDNGDQLYYKNILDTDGNITGRETTADHNAASYYYVGNSIPKVYGGITNTLTYKGFTLSALLTYQLGGDMYDSNYAALMHTGAFGSHWSSDILNRWQKPGDITDVPRLQNNRPALIAQSSRFLISSDFLSLRNVTLTYSLPSSLLNSIDVKDFRVFASGDNLGMLTKRKGMDPQQSFNGTADFTYVPSRVISLGVNVTF